MPELDATNFEVWAREAMVDYLENNNALSDSIAKIAEDNSLTPRQIGQVCRQANVLTYGTLFKSAEDKTFSFPLADAEGIVSALSEQSETAGVENAHLDYFISPPQKKAATDWKAAFGVETVSNEYEVAEKVAAVHQLSENIKQAQHEIERRRIDNQLDIEASRAKLASQMKQFIMAEQDKLAAVQDIANAAYFGSKHQGHAINEISKAATALKDEGVFGTKYMSKDVLVSIHNGIEKGADGKFKQDGKEHTVKVRMVDPGEIPVDCISISKSAEAVQESLISTTQLTGSAPPLDKVTIVNGNHPILVTVNQLVDQVSEEDRLKQGLLLLEDKAGYAIQRIDDLNTSAKVDAYVQRETAVIVERNKPNPDPLKRRFREGISA